jgi:hypothetical protein
MVEMLEAGVPARSANLVGDEGGGQTVLSLSYGMNARRDAATS